MGLWDAQKAGGTTVDVLAEVANIYIGLYGTKAGIPVEMMERLTDDFIAKKGTAQGQELGPTGQISHTPQAIFEQVRTGYALVQSGRVR